MQYKLVVVAGEAKQPELVIKPPTVIGRSRDADITLGHPLVSRRHCEITLGDDGLLVVEDLGSLNGTFHGDERITEAVYLEPGDLLTIGSVTFRAQYGENGAAAAGVPDFMAMDDEPGTKTVTIESEPKSVGKGKRPAAKETPQPEPATAESDDSFDAMFADVASPAAADSGAFVEDDSAVADEADPLADFSDLDDEPAAEAAVEEVEEEVVEVEEEFEEFAEDVADVDEAEPAVATAEVEVEEEFEALDESVDPDLTIAAPTSPIAKTKPAESTPQPTKPKAADDFDMGWLNGDGDEEGEEGAGSEHAAAEEGDGDLDDFFKNLG